MTPDALAALVSATVTDLIDANRISLPSGYRVQATVERPKNRDHGDYATNVAMTLAKPAHTEPLRAAAHFAVADQLEIG